jgi:hypothetical protein
MTFNGREPGELAGIKNIYGYDPEGNIIELIQCKPDTPIRVGALRT